MRLPIWMHISNGYASTGVRCAALGHSFRLVMSGDQVADNFRNKISRLSVCWDVPGFQGIWVLNDVFVSNCVHGNLFLVGQDEDSQKENFTYGRENNGWIFLTGRELGNPGRLFWIWMTKSCLPSPQLYPGAERGPSTWQILQKGMWMNSPGKCPLLGCFGKSPNLP